MLGGFRVFFGYVWRFIGQKPHEVRGFLRGSNKNLALQTTGWVDFSFYQDFLGSLFSPTATFFFWWTSDDFLNGFSADDVRCFLCVPWFLWNFETWYVWLVGVCQWTCFLVFCCWPFFNDSWKGGVQVLFSYRINSARTPKGFFLEGFCYIKLLPKKHPILGVLVYLLKKGHLS